MKRTRRRELLDPTVVRISNKNIPTCINSDSTGRIKLSLAAFNMLLTFRQCAEARRGRVRHLIDDESIVPVVLKHLRKISRINLFI